MYIKFIKPYTHKILQLIAFSLSPSIKHQIYYSKHPLHQSPAVAEPFLEPLEQAQPQRQLFPKANGSQRINKDGTKLCGSFRPTTPTQEPQERPRPQKKPSRMSATICAYY